MKMLLIAIAVLVAFFAIWFFLVVPAERRHHERKLEIVRNRIAKREAAGKAPTVSKNDDPETN